MCAVHPRSPLSSRAWSVVIAAVLLASVAAAQGPDPELTHTLTPVTPPVPAPQFELEDMDGEIHTLADYRGQVVLVNFWATWCPPCRKELPSMEAVHQALNDQGFAVIAVNQWESPDLVFAFLGQL
jgi:thiol-disulfide isomerase/thioredoxin